MFRLGSVLWRKDGSKDKVNFQVSAPFQLTTLMLQGNDWVLDV
jgi:hypothetical protein